jgi:tRNA 2-thiouridine synthesizing protein B
MLYMVNKSPLMFSNLQSLLRVAPAGDPILLYEDGVYAATKGAASEPLALQALASHPLYALQADVDARGLSALIDGIQLVDYAGFVRLVEQHHVVPWL